ncbi:GntT/GntP/DsdX family permease, partial [Staphylococcus auricularis]
MPSFAHKYLTSPILIPSFIIPISLFLQLPFLFLIPLLFTLPKKFFISNLNLPLPIPTSIPVTHRFLPPHPPPLPISQPVNPNIPHLFFYAIIIPFPIAIILGTFFPKLPYPLPPTPFTKTPKQHTLNPQPPLNQPTPP